MKILHIHPSLAGGGIESMICGLANEMAKTEDLTVVSIYVPKPRDVFWNKLSPQVKRASLGKEKEGFSISEIFKIYRFVKNGKYDVVNLHGFMYYYLLTVILLHRRIKFFYTVHSEASMENSPWDRRLLFIKRFYFKHNLVRPITISEASKESFTKFYGISSRLIPNGVMKPKIESNDIVEKYRWTSSTIVFVHAGRIDRPKNQLVLCQVFQRIINEGKDVVLLILGSIQNGDIYATLEPYFSKRIVYLGERNDIPQLMAHCDAMCLPSIWEGLPVTLLESLSVGCIPICSPVGGIPNVITDGVNGILSKSSREDDYFLAVKRYLHLSAEKKKNMQKNGIKTFEKYDIRKTNMSYLEYYKEGL